MRFRTLAQYRKPSAMFEAVRFDGSNEDECRAIVPERWPLRLGAWYFRQDGILRQCDDAQMREHYLPA